MAALRWVRRAESGNLDGEFADLAFLPLILGVLLLGIAFAMVGFWREGAGYATMNSAQVGAVAPSRGNSVQWSFWTGWTNAGSLNGGFAVDAPNRSATASMNMSQDFSFVWLGPWTFSIAAQTHTRSERFYPGGPICSGGSCNE